MLTFLLMARRSVFNSFFLILAFQLLSNTSWSKAITSRYTDLIDLSFVMFDLGFFDLDPSMKGHIIPNFFDQIYLPVSSLQLRSSQDQKERSAIRERSLTSPVPMIIARIGQIDSPTQKSQSHQLCKMNLNSGNSAQLMFLEFDQKTFTEVCASLKSRIAAHSDSIWQRLLAPKAHALTFDPICVQTGPVRRNRQDLKGVSSQVEAMQLVQRIGSCAADALRSTLSSATSAVDGVGKSFEALKKDPFELWNEIASQAKATVQFVLGIREQVQQFASALNGLPSEMQWKLGCHLIGEAAILLGAMAATAWTGATTAALSVRLVEVFMQMQKTSGALKYVQQLVKLGKGSKANEAVQCLLR